MSARRRSSPSRSSPSPAPANRFSAPPVETEAPVRTQIRITLVEDDPGLVAVFSMALDIKGVEVNSDCTVSLEQAKNRVDQEKPKLLITDLQFDLSNHGSLSGIKLARYVRTNYPTVRIILCTAYAHPLPEEAKELFDEILQKPVDFDELRGAVDRQLAYSSPR